MKAVLYLSEGLTRIGGDLHEDELLIWKYFLAKAYKLLVLKSHQTGFEMHLHNKWKVKAIQVLYDVIYGSDQMTMLNENKKEILKTNKARSYVNIGEILQRLPQGEDKSYLYSCIQDAEFCELIEESSLRAFETAKSIRPDDISVLVHYGNYLVHYTQGEKKDLDQEQRDIEKAIGMLSDAIEKDEGHWLAHVIRMTARKKMYTLTSRNHSRPNIELLKDAEKDGEFCFSSSPTILSLLEFSRILHWLADPTMGKASTRVDQDYLQKAIDVLITIESKFQHHNSPWVYKERASCHSIKKQVEEALIYTELAFYANTEVCSLYF